MSQSIYILFLQVTVNLKAKSEPSTTPTCLWLFVFLYHWRIRGNFATKIPLTTMCTVVFNSIFLLSKQYNFPCYFPSEMPEYYKMQFCWTILGSALQVCWVPHVSMSEKGNQETMLDKNLTPNYLCFLHLLGNKCLQ